MCICWQAVPELLTCVLLCRNSKGYEIAEHLSAKFTHVSPVWLQLRWDAAAAAFSVTGQHDIDADWMARVAQPKAKARSCMWKFLWALCLLAMSS